MKWKKGSLQRDIAWTILMNPDRKFMLEVKSTLTAMHCGEKHKRNFISFKCDLGVLGLAKLINSKWLHYFWKVDVNKSAELMKWQGDGLQMQHPPWIDNNPTVYSVVG